VIKLKGGRRKKMKIPNRPKEAGSLDGSEGRLKVFDILPALPK